jgi:seryl-tRNA synthetase
VTEWARWHPSGQVSLSGPLLRLAGQADAAFGLLAGAWNAEPERHPATLPADVLRSTGYLRSFPHQATFAVGLDPAALDGFAADPDQDPRPSLGPATEILTPAACYHLYPARAGQPLPGPLYLTTVNTCYRREAAYEPLRRQWSFTMREIVCLGTDAEAAEFTRKTRAAAGRLCELAGLGIDWRQATDPFFRPQQNPAYLLQKLTPVKHECVYPARRQDTEGLAIASANLHHEHFGEAFGITRHGEPAHSACVAFGIERWLFAITDAHGDDPRSWPDLPELAREVTGKWPSLLPAPAATWAAGSPRRWTVPSPWTAARPTSRRPAPWTGCRPPGSRTSCTPPR